MRRIPAVALSLIVQTHPLVADDEVNLCVPPDLNDNGVVGNDDLRALLAGWGSSGQADLDGSGAVDAADLALLLGAWGPCATECPLTLVQGLVRRLDGTPVAGAFVVSDFGGEALTDAAGHYSFEVAVPLDASAIELVATAMPDGVRLEGAAEVSQIDFGSISYAHPITIVPANQCQSEWVPTFGGEPGVSGALTDFVVFDDGRGGGPALFACGAFVEAGGNVVNRVAKWDGTHWWPLKGGMDGDVYALAVFDDGQGAGPLLVAGGAFALAGGVPAKNLAAWDGQTWVPIGDGVSAEGAQASVYALLAVDESDQGPALYVGGAFTHAGAIPARSIARWDGLEWSSLAGADADGVDGEVYAIAAGAGPGEEPPNVFIGGQFATAGGTAAKNVAQWDGASWSPLSGGTSGPVYAFATFDDGLGRSPALYVGGDFSVAGGVQAKGVARWDGTAWSSVGALGNVWSLLAVDGWGDQLDGLYAAGAFVSAGGVPAHSIARWDGRAWSALGTGVDGEVFALALWESDGVQAPATPPAIPPAIFVGGTMLHAGGTPVKRVARWSGDAWSALGSGLTSGVLALTELDDGSETHLVVGGAFESVGPSGTQGVAAWNGSSWSALGGGVDGLVRALTVVGDGAAPTLYVGGDFALAGGMPASRIAAWNDNRWSPLGSGLNGSVHAFAVHDDGSGAGERLYAAGDFTLAGGTEAKRIAAWDGESWSPVGEGMNTTIRTLAVFDDGAGPALYAGGAFTKVGTATVKRLAKWDGTTWSQVGGGVDGTVFALATFDDGLGSGRMLYVGGEISQAGSVLVKHLARWNGSAWSGVGSGTNGKVTALLASDDGEPYERFLYAAGAFSTAGYEPANGLARWNGAVWLELDGGLFGVTSLHASSNGTIHAGGWFESSVGGDSYVARWGCGARGE